MFSSIFHKIKGKKQIPLNVTPILQNTNLSQMEYE